MVCPHFCYKKCRKFHYVVKLDIIYDSTLFQVNTEIINLHQAGATVRKQINVAFFGGKSR